MGAQLAKAQSGILVDEVVPQHSCPCYTYLLFALRFALGVFAEANLKNKAAFRISGLSSTLLNNVLFPRNTNNNEDKISTRAESSSGFGFLSHAGEGEGSRERHCLYTPHRPWDVLDLVY